MTKTIFLTAIMLVMALSLFAQPNAKWAGKWVQNKNNSVTITKVTDKNFYFTFACYNGTNMGEAEGVAIINGNEAISNPEDEEICKIKFILKEDHIEVIDIRDDDCMMDAGNGVSYEGKYKAKKAKKK